MITLSDVRAAADAFEGAIDKTPFLHSKTLSDLTGADVYLKFENLQFTGSFKQRGALNKLLSLTQQERAKGVIAVSAGNHAQGVAYHAGQLGIPATIVMPATTPHVKAARTEALGAQVILEGTDFESAVRVMERIRTETGQTLIHPYDDEKVIAGQGTVGLEMIEQGPALDDVVVAVGGGGLISGMATAFKALSPNTQMYGVQTEVFPSMARVVRGYTKEAKPGATIAEGIAVAEPGHLTRLHVDQLVKDIFVVSEESIEEAVALLLQIEKTLCEGAGAAGLAAIKANGEQFAGRKVGLILCGGNIDNRLLIALLQRQQAREGKLLRLHCILADRAGQLGELCSLVGANGGNINTVNHDRTFSGKDAKCARVELEVEVNSGDAAPRIFSALDEAGIEFTQVQHDR